MAAQITNTLDRCITVDKIESSVHENIVLLKTEINVEQSPGVCGCKSAALQFNVKDQNSQVELISGIFTAFSNKIFSFPIQADYSIFKDASLVLTLACSNPR